MPKVAIVILNWNGVGFLQKFLPTVVEFAAEAEVIVVDNASTDASVDFLRKNYSEQVNTITLDKNYGFAEGYNRGLQQIEADYYILLNSDVEVTQGWWQPLIELLEQKPEIGAVQPKICAYNQKDHFEYAGACGGFLDKYGYPFCRGRILDSIEKDNGQYDTRMKVFWASGAAIAVRSSIFRDAGGFDATFFAHMEEIDLCWRMQRMGCEIYCEPQSVVYHVGGGTLPNESPFKLYLNFRNNLSMLYKNLEKSELLPILLVRMCLDGVAALRFLLGGNFKAVGSIWKAHLYFYKNFSRLKEQRKIVLKMGDKPVSRYEKSVLWQYFVKKQHFFSKIYRKKNKKVVE